MGLGFQNRCVGNAHVYIVLMFTGIISTDFMGFREFIR